MKKILSFYQQISLALLANKPSNKLAKLGTNHTNEINLSNTLALQIPDLLNPIDIYFHSH